MTDTKEVVIHSEKDLKVFLATNYMAQIKNFFGEEKQAMKFLSAVMSDVQKNPKLLECEPMSLINSYLTMAQFELMPSSISGEAYVLPYMKKGKLLAQFQLGVQGLITLFYRAGGQKLVAEIVRKNDVFSYKNGEINHEINVFKSNAERGDAVASYAIATVNEHHMVKAMNAADIINIGKVFSKSYNSEFSPWNPKNDPEMFMWKKTVLKQLGKMLPKNETINKAIAADNADSIISDRLESATKESEGLKMGHLLKAHEEKPEGKKESKVKAPTTEVVKDEEQGAPGWDEGAG